MIVRMMKFDFGILERDYYHLLNKNMESSPENKEV